MSSIINTNIFSLIAQRNLNSSQSSLQTSITRLSSGLRINSAADDAAGLAISDRMTAQINGTTQAQSNANDGISLVQTAAGALQEVTNNLQRIRTLAVQASNATNSDSDRAALDQEVQQRIAEINRLATQTTFNGQHVLDGTFGTATFQVGADAGQTISVNLSSGVKSTQIGQIAQSSQDLSSVIKAQGLTLNAGDLTIGGKAITGAFTDANGLAAAINAAGVSGLTATVSGGELRLSNSGASAVALGGNQASALFGATTSIAAATGGTTTPGTADLTYGGGAGGTLAAGDLTINGTNITGTYTDADSLAALINAQTATTGVSVTNASGTLTFSNSNTSNATIAGTQAATVLGTASTTVAAATVSGTTTPGTADSTGVATAIAAKSLTLASGDLTLQVGSNAAVDITGTFSSVQDLADAVNSSQVPGLKATVSTDGKTLTLTSQDTLTIGGTKAGAGAGNLNLAGTTAVGGSLATADVKTVSDAQQMIQRIDAAVNSVDSLQSTLGAVQNRFQSTISSLSTTTQNLTQARSGIQDTDYAAETANLTRSQILQQAGISMLAQANQLPQQVLKLLQ